LSTSGRPARALDVPQKLCAQSGAFVRALDQAGDVGDDEADLILVADDNHSQIWLQRGEGVVGDFRACRRDARDQRGFANIRKPNEANICEELEFQAENAFFAGAPVFVLARSLVGGGGETGIAASTAPAVSDDDALVGAGEVPDLLAGFLVVDNGADRDLQGDVDTFTACLIGAFAVASTFGFVFGIEAEVDERVVALAGFHDDVTTLAAIAAGGASAGDEFFAAESEAAVAAVAGFDSDCGFIDEHFLVVSGAEIADRWWPVANSRRPVSVRTPSAFGGLSSALMQTLSD
jgi:hypothetical protein